MTAPNSDPLITVVSWIEWFVSLEATLLAAPLTTWADMSGGAPAVSQTVYFGTLFLPLASDLIGLMFSESLMRRVPQMGPLAEGFGGLVILIAAVIYVVESANAPEDDKAGGPWDYANAIISNVARVFRILIAFIQWDDTVPIVDAETYAVVLTVVMVGDALSLLGGTATQIGSATNG
jgi:hypothetical protein